MRGLPHVSGGGEQFFSQDTIVGEGTKLEYIISDKNVKITDGKELKGDEAFPVFVAKGQVV